MWNLNIYLVQPHEARRQARELHLSRATSYRRSGRSAGVRQRVGGRGVSQARVWIHGAQAGRVNYNHLTAGGRIGRRHQLTIRVLDRAACAVQRKYSRHGDLDVDFHRDTVRAASPGDEDSLAAGRSLKINLFLAVHVCCRKDR